MGTTEEQQRRIAFVRRLETLLFTRYTGGPPEHIYAIKEQLPKVLAQFDEELKQARTDLEFAQKLPDAKERVREQIRSVRSMVRDALKTNKPINIIDGRYSFQDRLYELNQLSIAAYSADYRGLTLKRGEGGGIHVMGRDDPKAYLRSRDAKQSLESFRELLGGLDDAILAADYYYVPAIATVIEASRMTHPGHEEKTFYEAMKRYGEVYHQMKLDEPIHEPDGERPKEMRDILPGATDERKMPLYPPPIDVSVSAMIEQGNFDPMRRMRAIEKINAVPVPSEREFEQGPFEKAMNGWNGWARDHSKPLSDEKSFGMPAYARHRDMTPRKFLNECDRFAEHGQEWLDTMHKVSGILEKSGRERGNGRDTELADYVNRYAGTLDTVYTEVRSQRRLAGIPPSTYEPPYPEIRGRAQQ
jgi:hypothetical protein